MHSVRPRFARPSASGVNPSWPPISREVTPAGERFLCSFGVDLKPPSSRRIYCRPCLDWSERRYHIKGVVGARILCRCMELGWIARTALPGRSAMYADSVRPPASSKNSTTGSSLRVVTGG